MKVLKYYIYILLSFLVLNRQVYADSIEDLGDALQIFIPAYAFGLSMNEDTYEGVKYFGYSFLSTQVSVELLKVLTKEKRPNYKDGDRKDSFPSGHTAQAFSGATFIHKRYGFKRAVVPYLMATFVGYSRIDVEKHHTRDVIAGALISSMYTWIFTGRRENNNSNILFGTDGKTAKLEYRVSF